MTKTRHQKMNMELGELREPIAPLCNLKIGNWNRIIRIHLKYPKADGNALLDGMRIFALELDEKTTIAKVSRGFDNITSNNDLILKIPISPSRNFQFLSFLKSLSKTASDATRSSRLPRF
jgi:hypothetical protein